MIGANANINIIINALDKTAGAFKAVEGRMGGVADRMGDIGGQMSMAVTAPLAIAGGAIAKIAIDSEAAFVGVRKTVNATEEEFVKLRKEFDNLAKTTPIAVTEIYRIGEAAGQLGIEKEHLVGFTETMAQLGFTTNMTSERAAMDLARLAAITQMPQDNFDKLGSTIVELGNNSATTEGEIVSLGLRLAAAGNQIGLTEAEILGIAAGLSSVGIRAEAGGTAVSQAMRIMNTAVKSGGAEVKTFAKVSGMSVEEFSELFEKDAANAVISFIEGLGKLGDQGEDLTPILEELGMGGIRMTDAFLRTAGAGDLMRESVEMGTEAWKKNVALEEEAARQRETTASQIQILKNHIVIMANRIGDHLLPMIDKLIKNYLIPLVSRIKELSPETIKVIVVIAALAAVIGPLLIILSVLIKGVMVLKTAYLGLVAIKKFLIAKTIALKAKTAFLSGAFAALKTKIILLSGKFALMGAKIKVLYTAALPKIAAGVKFLITALKALAIKIIVLLAKPILIIAAIGAIVSAAWWLWKNWDKVVAHIGGLWDKLKNWIWEKLQKPIEFLGEIWTSVWEGIGNLVERTKERVMGPINAIREGLEGIIDAARRAIEWLNRQKEAAARGVRRAVDRTIEISPIGQARGAVARARELIGRARELMGRKQLGGLIPETGRYLMHRGEQVVPVHRAMTGAITVNITGGTYLSEDAAEKMGDLIIKRLKENLRI